MKRWPPRWWAWWLVTRCGWCDGRYYRDDPVNVGLVDSTRDLYHVDCAEYATAHTTCLCRSPMVAGADAGVCGVCRKYRQAPRSAQWRDAYRLLAARPWGDRNLWTYRMFQRALYKEPSQTG